MNALFDDLVEGKVTTDEALRRYRDAYEYLYNRGCHVSDALIQHGDELISLLVDAYPATWKRLLEARSGDPFSSDREVAAFALAFLL